MGAWGTGPSRVLEAFRERFHATYLLDSEYPGIAWLMPKEHGGFHLVSPDRRPDRTKRSISVKNPADCRLLVTCRRLGHFRPPPGFWGECYLGCVYPDSFEVYGIPSITRLYPKGTSGVCCGTCTPRKAFPKVLGVAAREAYTRCAQARL